jgi:hypothetical protein
MVSRQHLYGTNVTLTIRRRVASKCRVLAKRSLKRTASATSEMVVEIDRMFAELNENYHTNIEEVFKPYLDLLLAGTLSFLEDPAKASLFYFGLAVQYLRTNHIKGTKRGLVKLFENRGKRWKTGRYPCIEK